MANNNISSNNSEAEGMTAMHLGTSWTLGESGINLQPLTGAHGYPSPSAEALS